jgi:hypothetical protein
MLGVIARSHLRAARESCISLKFRDREEFFLARMKGSLLQECHCRDVVADSGVPHWQLAAAPAGVISHEIREGHAHGEETK